MSGPKAVRIETKQERVARCQARIRALQNVIKQWRKCAFKYDAFVVGDEKDINKRCENVIEMLGRERFNEVERQCQIEISSIQADIKNIRNEAIARAERERSLRRRLQYSAETLILSFKASGHSIPSELKDITINVLNAKEHELPEINKLLTRILAKITNIQANQSKLTPLQKELCKKLSDGNDGVQTLADWKLKNKSETKIVELDQRIDTLLAEVVTTVGESNVQRFLDRAVLITKEESSNRRALLSDSLILELVQYSNNRQVKERVISSMLEVQNELQQLSSEAALNLSENLQKAIDAEDVESSEVLIQEGQSLLEKEINAKSAASRREVMLKGLSELGYEIRENMATAWAENERLVIRKPNETDYGVELGAIKDAERMQVRLVSFDRADNDSNSSRDIDRETIWCSEFSHLKSFINKSGAVLHIDKALPVGAVPIKKVDMSAITSKSSASGMPAFKKKAHE